jgi:carbon monoxide dehydrogenase subunit G
MTSTHEALVRRSIGDVMAQLQNSERMLTALPGATLSREPDGASGSLKLKLGSHQITYRVTVRATGPADPPLAATIAVSGKEARGAGTLAATVQVELHELHEAGDDATTVRVTLDVTATGRGEGVSDEAWGRAAESLLAGVVAELTEAAPPEPPPAPAAAVTAAPAPAARPAPIIDVPPRPIGPVPSTPGPSPRRLAAAAAFTLVLLVLLRRARRRRSS